MTTTNEPARSPAPGIIPERPRIPENASAPIAAAHRPDPRTKRRNPVNAVLGKVMSALRGDKYMVDAYPVAGPERAPTSDSPATPAEQAGPFPARHDSRRQ